MIVYSILIILKVFLYMKLCSVEKKRSWVFISMASFCLTILSLFSLSNGVNFRIWGRFLAYSILCLIMFIDSVYMGYFGNRPSVLLLRSAGLLGDVMDSVQRMMSFDRVLLIVDIPIFLFIKRRVEEIKLIENPWIPLLIFLSIYILTLLLAKLKRRFIVLKNQDSFVFHITDLIDSHGVLKDIPKKKMDPSQLDQVYEKQVNKKKNSMTGKFKGKNLIIIQVEGLQNFVIDFFYKGQEITPNLNAFIRKKGIIYNTDHMQNLGVGNTSDAEFAVFNSLYPSKEMASVFQYGNKDYYSLASLLKEEGYSSWAFHAFNPKYYDRDKNFPKWGYDRFVNAEDFVMSRKVQMGMDDREFFSQSLPLLKKLRDSSERYYAHMISLTSHTPFKMPEDHKFLKIGEELENTMVSDYLQAVHYVDSCLGEFIGTLEDEGFLDEAILVLYGDHYGISIVEDENRKNMETLLGKSYTPDLMMNIPLIFKLPEDTEAKKISKLTCPVDLYPSLINLLGYENKKGIMMGRDIFDDDPEDLIIPQQTYIPRGSFISEDVVFNSGPTGLFEDSFAISRTSHEKISSRPYRGTMKNALHILDLNDYILKTNSIVREEYKEDLTQKDLEKKED